MHIVKHSIAQHSTAHSLLFTFMDHEVREKTYSEWMRCLGFYAVWRSLWNTGIIFYSHFGCYIFEDFTMVWTKFYGDFFLSSRSSSFLLWEEKRSHVLNEIKSRVALECVHVSVRFVALKMCWVFRTAFTTLVRIVFKQSDTKSVLCHFL